MGLHLLVSKATNSTPSLAQSPNASFSGIAKVLLSSSTKVEYLHPLIEIEALKGSESHHGGKAMKGKSAKAFCRKKGLFLQTQRPPVVAPSIRPVCIQQNDGMVMLLV